MKLKQLMNVTAIACLLAAAPVYAEKAAAAKQKMFAAPTAAASALAEAIRAADPQALLAVVGPTSAPWLFSGDRVADREDWKRFLAAYDRKHDIQMSGDARGVLVVGDDAWPFPAPLVKKGADWMFDPAAGREEIINRRVGRNELSTMQTLLAIVDAQREYATEDLDRNGYRDYAAKIRSSAGKRDGLYWPVAAGEAPSPLGELIAQAAREGYGKSSQPAPYHGYHFRVLTAQGKHAQGGAYEYLVKGRLIGGFALIAYPAKYGASGVMSFMVNHDGVIYEKDLGPATASAVSKIVRFDPGPGWSKASLPATKTN